MKSNMQQRYLFIVLVFTAFAGAIIFYLFYLTFGASANSAEAGGQEIRYRIEYISPERGKIYDRWGHLLAGNKKVYEVGIDRYAVQSPETIALALSVILGKDYDEVLRIASDKDSDIRYVTVDRYVEEDKIARIIALQDNIQQNRINGIKRFDREGNPESLDGLAYRGYLIRSYPEGALASNVLGFVSLAEQRGYFGVEEFYNELLGGGEPIAVKIPLDPRLAFDYPKIPKGVDLVLTIDREIQAWVEALLDKTVEEQEAKGGTIVVMDLTTGEILAMASNPRIDINHYVEYMDLFDNDLAFNMAVKQYEPGSVFKIFTMASALDAGAVKPDTEFVDVGVYKIGGLEFKNWDRGAYGPVNMTECLQYSLNTCLSYVADQLGPEKYYPYLQKFGFGKITNIGLGDEDKGVLKMPGDNGWSDSDLGANSFGQAIEATPIQILMAASAIATDGRMIQPRIVHGIIDNGRMYPTLRHYVGNPISEETAKTLSNMLAQSLASETYVDFIDGYRFAGKTGTAEIYVQNKGYTSDKTNASFIGWGPVDDPRIMVYVWIKEPAGTWGSVVAAPVFNQVMSKLVTVLNLPPDDVRQELETQLNSVKGTEQ